MEEPQSPSAFGAKRALGVFFAYVGFQLAFGAAAAIVAALTQGGQLAHRPPSRELLRVTVLWGAFFGLAGSGAMTAWMTWYLLGRRVENLRPLGCARAGADAVWAGAGLGLACAAAFLAMFAAFPPPPDFRPGPMRSAVESGGRLAIYAWTVLAVAVAPPVEEFVFRGAVWTGLRASWGPAAAAIVTTLLFVALHLVEAFRYPPALAAIGTMGLVALAMRVRHASLVPAIAVHATYNAAVALASFAAR